MKTITTLLDLRLSRSGLPQPIGFVPTMGYLHAGHISLAQRARQECSSVIASIFVNPTQFGPNEDLAAYPRNITRDLELLEAVGVDLVWLPTPEMMYPPGFQTWVTVAEVTRSLEGEHRPGHFRGVATVVAKLFNAVQPQKAYFGQKDAQQVTVIRTMTQDLNFPVEVVVCPTVREPDGLALSSRNVYLNPAERCAATVLYRALIAARSAWEAGEIMAVQLRQIMIEIIDEEPLAHRQYVSCADPESLVELTGQVRCALISMAVLIGKTRLIDNVLIG